MWHLPLELLNDVVLLEDLSGWASHSQDVISDPTDGKEGLVRCTKPRMFQL